MKTTLAAALLLAISTASIAAPDNAADYPDRPIRMLLPFSAGGGGDILGRLLAERLSARLRQPVVVENKPGAAGTIGTHAVATAAADGYTIMIGGMSTHQLAPATYAKLPYDPLRDFQSLGAIGSSSIVMVASNSYPANNLAETIAMARRQMAQGQAAPIQYASWGAGSTGHFCGEVLRQKTGIAMQHVPYKGTSQIITDILGNHIAVGFVDMVTATPFVKEGKVKALAVCTRRSPSLPQVPSYKEQGVDFDRELNWAAYVPAKTPKPIVDKLSAALEGTLKEPEVVNKLLSLGISARYLSGAEQQAINARDIPIWKEIARQANISLD
ncbi:MULTISPECIES: Bug family tripartite tricarboxylate transporter substrate binding protein [Cupriavidus]|uniref:Tripartite tricarboxylate transporter substrate binding protein n=1 Tax=Cupriavidus pauculus TaxID=82633 RepID=A0A5P2H057_9BURK|nr:tripartite tricarboxylate transporter substrate binding protein [Cupriavidus pauculus]QET01216.1 tripartite tricarboxylate transporter substrate binding protein [Cupriavidus pauculus]